MQARETSSASAAASVALLTTKANEGRPRHRRARIAFGAERAHARRSARRPRTASDEEVRRAYQKQREVYANGSIA